MNNKIRNPKSEIRNKTERGIRSEMPAFSNRLSDFGNTAHSILTCFLAALLIISTGCRRDMFNQPFSKPLERSDFFKDNHMASRPLVNFTVARGHLNENEAFYTGKIATNLVEDFPFPITRELLERGRERFD